MWQIDKLFTLAIMRIGLTLVVITCGISFADVAMADSAEIAKVICNPKNNYFSLEYLSPYENDSATEVPAKFRRACRLHNATYIITGVRGPYSQSRCGAQPPVSIKITRNGIELVTDAVFGDNCFMGPAISKVEISDEGGMIKSLKLCILEKPYDEKTICRTFDEGHQEISNARPIDQSKLSDYIAEPKP